MSASRAVNETTAFKSLMVVNHTGAIIGRRLWPTFKQLNLVSVSKFDLPSIGGSNRRLVLPFVGHADLIEVSVTGNLSTIQQTGRLAYNPNTATFTCFETDANSTYVFATTSDAIHRLDFAGQSHLQTKLPSAEFATLQAMAFYRDYLLTSGSTTLAALGELPVTVLNKFNMTTVRSMRLAWPDDFVKRVYESVSLLVSPLNDSHLIVYDRQSIRSFVITADMTVDSQRQYIFTSFISQYPGDIRAVKFVSGTPFIVVDIDQPPRFGRRLLQMPVPGQSSTNLGVIFIPADVTKWQSSQVAGFDIEAQSYESRKYAGTAFGRQQADVFTFMAWNYYT